MNDLEEIVYKHALLNAAKHKGSANPGAVIGSIMSQEPDLRSRAKEIGPIAGKIVAQVNKLSEDEQSAQMAKYHVEVKENKQKKEEGLQETDNKLIHIGKPIEFDKENFFDNLEKLKEEAYSETGNIRESLKKVVDTYHPNEH